MASSKKGSDGFTGKTGRTVVYLPNGKIGQAVIAKWRQLTVGRSKPRKSTKRASVEQLDTQSEFKLVISFVSRIGTTIALGYRNSAGNLTPQNTAVQYHIQNTVTGIYPAYHLNKLSTKAGDLSNIDLCLRCLIFSAKYSKRVKGDSYIKVKRRVWLNFIDRITKTILLLEKSAIWCQGDPRLARQ